MRKTIILVFCLIAIQVVAQNSATEFKLTIENIMREPKWIGTSPSGIYWSEDGSKIYFNWNRYFAMNDSLFSYSIKEEKIRALSLEERKALVPQYGVYNKAKSKKLFEKNGDIFLFDIKGQTHKQITNTNERESNPRFSFDEKKIIYTFNGNLFSWNLQNGETNQITDFRKGAKRNEQGEQISEAEKYLKQQELSLFEVLRKRKHNKEAQEKLMKQFSVKRPKEIYVQEKNVNMIMLSPDENYVTFRLDKSPKNSKSTIVPNYVTETGYTQDIPARTNVGVEQTTYELGIYDIKRDSVYFVDIKSLPGIFDKPEYLIEYITLKDSAKKEIKKEKARDVSFSGPIYSQNGKNGIIVVRSQDSKDRWIASLELSSGKIKCLERQHDEAWIGGPNIGWGNASIGWLDDSKRIYFQSEETGYSHLYTLNVDSGERKQLTSGKYEVHEVQRSNNGKYFYITTSEVHPGERHFYKLSVDGGKAEKITSLTGNNDVMLSPDETKIALRYSYSNKPWELYLMDNKTGAIPKQITNSTSAEFNSYKWREPSVITFKASDGEDVYARLYKPEKSKSNKAAVIFVHGAGYLQNAHKWWSEYFREYMFNNLLVDNGYTVLDIDYRASSGYGRKWRTDIYRNMGGKDLSDNVDGAKYLIENHGIDSKRIGLYGGSYGGFITLMAMFKEPNIFAAGAALRPVTDWAHYNHGYTANILNIPQLDSIAYKKSSPIYYADGLKGALLICHGMVDDNVHFQDVVRLSQKLIELGKDNWELAVYPVESHGFVEPSSWTDEYKRIFKLFQNNLIKKD
ncbi:MAG: prolyl oligopeptidase family serine peptidase [Melioribacteraceae bacterium]